MKLKKMHKKKKTINLPVSRLMHPGTPPAPALWAEQTHPQKPSGGEVFTTEAAQQYLLHSSQFPEGLRSHRLQQPNLSGSSNISQSAASLTSYQTGGETQSPLTRPRDRVADTVTCKPGEQSLDQSEASRGFRTIRAPTYLDELQHLQQTLGGDRDIKLVWNQFGNGLNDS